MEPNVVEFMNYEKYFGTLFDSLGKSSGEVLPAEIQKTVNEYQQQQQQEPRQQQRQQQQQQQQQRQCC